MKRVYVLGVVVLAGVMAVAAAELGAQAPAGQAAPPGAGRGPGEPVGKIEKVADNLYTIPGQGGNTAVYIAANGVVLVDTKNPNNGEALLAQVKSVTPKPITHIINTHTHADHNGSNVYFPATVEIVTHENTAANMKKLPLYADAKSQHGLPDRTYKDRETVLSGNDAIDLYYFGPAHTNGDTFVVFRNARVMHAGDVFARKAQPNVDRNNGGSGVQYGETIAKAASGIKNVQSVITGHTTGPNSLQRWQDFVDYGEFNRLMVSHARESMKAGKSPEQAMTDFKLPSKFQGYTAPAAGRGNPGGNFTGLYEELKTAK